MLTHGLAKFRKPKRLVVIGAAGFVGRSVVECALNHDMNVIPITRSQVDLLEPGASARLVELLQDGDCVVAASAIAPCKDAAMLADNFTLVRNMAEALADRDIEHVINVSSDAIYPDKPLPLTESVPPSPSSIHGVMHLGREIVLSSAVQAPLVHLRSTLIYGPGDPHNGYGPNRFRRQAKAGEDIILFGEGEEQRDHVYITDVAKLICLAASRRSEGSLNVATGSVYSFREIAECVADLVENEVEIRPSPRVGAMPHGGYRPFSTKGVEEAFPDFSFVQLPKGLAMAQRAEE